MCPACSAQYTLAAARLDGRRAKVRCKRCGESFPVDPPQPSGEVCARREESATPLTGERNESSVLFSLAALAKQAPAPPAPNVTESSADIVNLGGGGAFAPLFAPPVTFVPAENEEAARRGKRPIMIAAMALAVVAMVGTTAFVGVRARSRAPAAKAVAAATAVSAPAEVPSIAVAAPSSTALDSITPVKTSTTSTVAPPARSAARANDARPVATQVATVSTPSTAPKCCAGESEIACHMRVAAGAACGAEPPFDRLAASRALGVNVSSCKRGDGPTGAGHVKVTFQPSGSVSAVDVDAPYAGTATGACVAQRYRGASVPAFAGGPLSVGKSFAIE